MADIVIGVDPGNNGGAVVLVDGSLVRSFKLARGEEAITQFFHAEVMAKPSLMAAGRVVAYLEKVHGWGEGRSFNFGKYYGFVRGVLYSCGLMVENGCLIDVPPQTWMKAMGVPPQKGQKAAHRQAMREMADRIQDDVSATNWNAAAILIAFYGQQEQGLRE